MERFLPLAERHVLEENRERWQNSGDEQLANAKQCALIVVDEILLDIKEPPSPVAVTYNRGRAKFWTEVKSEIEKL